jgi:hypothetical protein
LECGGFGFESGDGFDEAGDGEGVADAARAADEAENAAFAGQLDGNAHQRGNARAINLGDAVQDDDNFLGAGFDDAFQSVVKLLGGLADGEPAVNFEYGHRAGFADVDFHGQPVSHGGTSTYPMWAAMAIHHAARHYTLAGKLDKVVGEGERFQKFTGQFIREQEKDASEKQIQGMKISNRVRGRACV